MPPALAIATWLSALRASFASAAAACSFRLSTLSCRIHSPPPLSCSTSSGTSDMLRLIHSGLRMSSANAASACFIIAGTTLLEIARACSSFAKRAAAAALAACRAATFAIAAQKKNTSRVAGLLLALKSRKKRRKSDRLHKTMRVCVCVCVVVISYQESLWARNRADTVTQHGGDRQPAAAASKQHNGFEQISLPISLSAGWKYLAS